MSSCNRQYAFHDGKFIFYGQMGQISFLKCFFFKYNFGDYWDIHAMQSIILGYLFPTIAMEIRTFHFRTSMIQGGGGGYFFS